MYLSRSGRSLHTPCVLAIVCLLLPSSNAQENLSPLQKHFLAAQQDQQQGLLDAAAHEYETVVRLQPELAEAYVNLGLVYYSQAKFNESARVLTTAARLKPGMRGVSLWLGIDNVKLNRPTQGAAHLREAIHLDPADKLAQSWLATALWDTGQMDAALIQLGKACAQFPDDPDLLFERGEAYGKAASQQIEQLLEELSGTALSDLIYGRHYVEEGDWTKAEGHLRRAIERDPHLLEARLELAEVLVQQFDLAAAHEQLEQAVTLAPQSAAALARSGELLVLMHEQSEGLLRIKKAIEIDQNEALDALGLPVEDRFDQRDRSHEDSRLALRSREAARLIEADQASGPVGNAAIAGLYALAGEDEAALKAYARIDISHSAPRATANPLAQALTAIHQHHFELAEPLLLRWVASHPADRTARYHLIAVRREIAMTQVNRLLTVAPDSYHLHQLLGQLYVSREEDDKALEEYLAVAAARPNLPGVHFWLGHLYWKHGDADHALVELKRELEFSPGHPEASAELGTVLVAQEHAAEAIPYLESALRAKPDLWPAYAQLGHAYAMQENYPRAEIVLKRGIEHDHDAATHYQLALVLRAEGKTAQAAQVFAEVAAIKREKMAAPPRDDQANQGDTQ